jgi:hypothetical protein
MTDVDPVPSTDAAAATPTWDAVVDRIVTRQRRRSRTSIAILAALALAGPVVAVLVTKNRTRSTTTAAPVATTDVSTTTTTAAPASTTSTSMVPVTTVAKIAGGIENQIFGQQLFDPVFVDTYDRYTVRLFKTRRDGTNNPWGPWGPNGVTDENGKQWNPPVDCFPTNYVAQISDPAIATRIDFVLGGDARMSQMFGNSSVVATPIGIEEQAPAWVAIFPVPANQKGAKVAFPNGVVADALVRDGFAIAVRPDPKLDWQTAGASQRMRVDLGEGLVRLKAPKQTARPECRLPANFGGGAQMPNPGEGPQNSNAAAAKIEEVVLIFIDNATAPADRAALVDKPGDLETVFEKLKPFINQQFGGGFPGMMPEPTVIDTIFTSPTAASAEVLYGGNSIRVDVTLVGGSWKLSRESACTTLQYFSPGCQVGDFPFGPNGDSGPFPTIAVAVATTAAPTSTTTAVSK